MHATRTRCSVLSQPSSQPQVTMCVPQHILLGVTGGRPSQVICGVGARRGAQVVGASSCQGAGSGGCRRQRARAPTVSAPLHLQRGALHRHIIPGRHGRGCAHRSLGVRLQAAVRMLPCCLSSADAGLPAMFSAQTHTSAEAC